MKVEQYNNDGNGQDIFIEKGNRGVYISSFALGGGYNRWNDENGTEVVTGKHNGDGNVVLSSFINGSDVGNGTVNITENTSSSADGVGGIYCEGNLNIGTSDNSAIKIDVEADDDAINASRNHGQFGFYIKLKGEDINSKRIYFQDTGYNVANANATRQEDGSYLINPIVDIRPNDKKASFYILNVPENIEYEITELNPILKVNTQITKGTRIAKKDDRTFTGTMTNIDNYDTPIQNVTKEGNTINSKYSLLTNVILQYQNSISRGGHLTVKNEVEDNKNNEDFYFTLKLESPTEPKYTPISGKFGGLTFENGEATFKLEDGKEMTFDDLPEGAHYTIEEKHTIGYKPIYDNYASGTITSEEKTTIINSKKSSGGLSITNNVDNEVKNADDLLFTITLLDGTVEGKYVGDITGKYGDIDFDHGIARFTLKAWETKEALNLPSWVSYVVEEAYDENYTVTSEYNEGIIEADENIPVVFTNTRNKGDLKVSKKVEGEDNNKTYNFTITLDDDSVNGEFGDMNFTNGVATFTLKNNETKIAKRLPSGVHYTVEEKEVNKNGYTTVIKGNEGVIKSDEVSEAEFKDTKNIVAKIINSITPPNTMDNIIIYCIIFIISIIGLFLSLKHHKKVRS